MATPNQSIFVEPDSYIDGLYLDYVSATTFTISNGYCRDSENLFNMVLSLGVTVDTAVTGANGIDQGTFAQDTTYAVHLIADSTKNQPVAGMISTSVTAPSLPSGYDSFRRIGWVFSEAASAAIESFNQYGSGMSRFYAFNASRLCLSAGAATTFTKVVATNSPPIDRIVTVIDYTFDANTATNRLTLNPVDTTAAGNIIVSPGVTTAVNGQLHLPTKFVSGDSAASFYYKVTNASDAASIAVKGFYDALG